MTRYVRRQDPETRTTVPTQKAEFTGDEVEDEEDENEPTDDEQSEEDRREEIHQELREEFARKVGIDLREADRMFGGLIKDVKEQKKEKEEYGVCGYNADAQLYVLFEKNHPAIAHPDEDEYDDLDRMEVLYTVTRIVRKYRHGWGIENGFKQIKRFRVRTTAMEYEHRFFNFLYACTLCNV